MPAPKSPAYSVVGVFGSTASAVTKPNVVPPASPVHFVPLFVVRYTPEPPFVPTYTVAGVFGSTASARAANWNPLKVRPLFFEVHVDPLFVERNTPASVPAYAIDVFVGSNTIA